MFRCAGEPGAKGVLEVPSRTGDGSVNACSQRRRPLEIPAWTQACRSIWGGGRPGCSIHHGITIGGIPGGGTYGRALPCLTAECKTNSTRFTPAIVAPKEKFGKLELEARARRTPVRLFCGRHRASYDCFLEPTGRDRMASIRRDDILGEIVSHRLRALLLALQMPIGDMTV